MAHFKWTNNLDLKSDHITVKEVSYRSSLNYESECEEFPCFSTFDRKTCFHRCVIYTYRVIAVIIGRESILY